MRKWAEKAAKIIVDIYDPDKIILFGSCAKGSENLFSDIDLLIVKETDISRKYRGVEVSSALSKFPVKFDLLFYTYCEFAYEQAKVYSFLNSIVDSGIILYEKK